MFREHMASVRSTRVLKMLNAPTFQNTKPELAVYSMLDELKVRYSKHSVIGFSKPDAVVNDRLAIFVDGCYWHACPVCFDLEKLPGHRRQMRYLDHRVTNMLVTLDMGVIRVWEHEIAKWPNHVRALIAEAIAQTSSLPITVGNVLLR